MSYFLLYDLIVKSKLKTKIKLPSFFFGSHFFIAVALSKINEIYMNDNRTAIHDGCLQRLGKQIIPAVRR